MFKMSGREGFTGKGYWHKDLEEIGGTHTSTWRKGNQQVQGPQGRSRPAFPEKRKEACNCDRWGGAEDTRERAGRRGRLHCLGRTLVLLE